MFFRCWWQAFVKGWNFYCALYNLFISPSFHELTELSGCMLCRNRLHYWIRLFALSAVEAKHHQLMDLSATSYAYFQIQQWAAWQLHTSHQLVCRMLLRSDVTTKLFPNKRSRCYKKREGLVYAERWRSNLAFRTLFGRSESVSVFRTLKARSVVNISRTPEMCSGETERQRSKQHANVYERTLTFKQERLCSTYSDRTPRTRSQSVSTECSILCSQLEHSGLEWGLYPRGSR